jgi:UDP-glucose 4-epimerase
VTRVLVTGGSGFIGSTLVAALRASGAEVYVADLRAFPDEAISTIVGDLREPGVLAEALAPSPEVIFHLAARTSVLQSVQDPQGVFDVNVLLTQRLLEAARASAVRSFVFASTNAVVGETDGSLIDEASILRPLTPYGATKAAAEMLCSAYSSSYGIAACSIRFTNVYGHGMGAKDTFIVRMLRAAAAGQPVTIYGDGLQERDYLYIDDAVAALLRASERSLTGPLTVGTGTSTSVLDVCRVASEAIDVPIDTRHVAAPAGEMRAVRVDITKARSLGYEPGVSLPLGLVRTWDSLRANQEFSQSSRERGAT